MFRMMFTTNYSKNTTLGKLFAHTNRDIVKMDFDLDKRIKESVA